MADLIKPSAGWTSHQFLEFKRLYEDGATDQRISAEIGKTAGAIKNLRLRSDLPANSVLKRRPVSAASGAVIKSMFEAGKKDPEIAAVLGLPKHIILYYRQKHGLTIVKPRRGLVSFTEQLDRQSDADEARLNRFWDDAQDSSDGFLQALREQGYKPLSDAPGLKPGRAVAIIRPELHSSVGSPAASCAGA